MVTKLQIFKHDNGGTRIGVEIRDMVKNLEWTTDLNHSAGELTFDVVNGKDPIIPVMGATVDFAWGNKDIFWGFVFSIECTSDTTVSVKAYDFERYLKNEGLVVFQSGTPGGRHSNVCRRFDVSFHIKEQPTYGMPVEVCDGKTGFDMIESAIDKTYSAIGEMYCVVASRMYIELRRASIPTRTFLVIDTQNTMNDYTYLESIGNAANVVQVAQKNTDNSQTKTATATSDIGDDPATTSFTVVPARGNAIRTWGQTVKIANTKNKANWAWVVRQTNDEPKKRNVSERKLTFDYIGDTSLTAGAGANVRIRDLGKIWTNCPILKATHSLRTGHTCSLEMKVGIEWQGNNL